MIFQLHYTFNGKLFKVTFAISLKNFLLQFCFPFEVQKPYSIVAASVLYFAVKKVFMFCYVYVFVSVLLCLCFCDCAVMFMFLYLCCYVLFLYLFCYVMFLYLCCYVMFLCLFFTPITVKNVYVFLMCPLFCPYGLTMRDGGLS
jgi:hypothetical protein